MRLNASEVELNPPKHRRAREMEIDAGERGLYLEQKQKQDGL